MSDGHERRGRPTTHGSQATRVSFVVRVVRDTRGRISGVIERVATGAKEGFQGGDRLRCAGSRQRNANE
jgi:hypothetical protein